MAQSSMSRSFFLAASFHGRRLHLGEVPCRMIALKHAHLRLVAIEEDRRRLITDPLVVEDIALRHPPGEAHRQGGIEAAQPRETAI